MKIACFAAFAGALLAAAAWAQTANPDPCKLLKPDDIAATFGAGFKPVVAGGGCNFVRRSDTVMIGMQRSTEPASNVIATQRDATDGAKAVPGVCDAAFARPSGSLAAGKGTWLVSIQTNIGGKPDVAGAGKLAALLCSRL